MSEGEYQAPATLRNFRMVRCIGGHLAGSVVKDSWVTARRRRPTNMAEGADKLDALPSFNERDVLTHARRLRIYVAQNLAVQSFEVFDTNRRAAEALAADEADFTQPEEMVKFAKKGRKKGGG